MPGSRIPARVVPGQVFLNVPYGPSHERILVALTAALVALGRIPRLTSEVADGGEGRLSRIFALLKSCPVSFHDLSAVGLPVRFNMPFELGLACAIKELEGSHDFYLLEREEHRLSKHLTDIRKVDEKVHGGTAIGAIKAVLNTLTRPAGNPTATKVMKLYRKMSRKLPELKADHATNEVYSSSLYHALVLLGKTEAEAMGL